MKYTDEEHRINKAYNDAYVKSLEEIRQTHKTGME